MFRRYAVTNCALRRPRRPRAPDRTAATTCARELSRPPPMTAAASPPPRVTDLIDFALRVAARDAACRTACFCFERRAGAARAARPLAALHADGRARAAARARGRLRAALRRRRAHAVDWRELDWRATLTPGDIGLMLWIDARRGGGRGAELAERLDARAGGARRPAGAAGHGARLDRHRPRAPRRGGRQRDRRAPARRGARPAARAQPRRERPVPPLRRRAAGAAASRTSPRRSTPCWRSRWSRGLGLDDRALPAARARRPTGCSRIQLPTAAGHGCSTPSAARSSSATRSTRCTRTRWRRWRCSSCGRRPATSATSTRGRAWPALDPRRERARRRTWSTARTGSCCARSAARRGPDRLWLAAKTGASLAGLPARGSTARLTEPNPTDRPYHFGWVLEAWCGREDALGERLTWVQPETWRRSRMTT